MKRFRIMEEGTLLRTTKITDLDMKRFRDARLKEETSGHPVSLLEATLRQLRLRKIRKTCMFLINVLYSLAL